MKSLSPAAALALGLACTLLVGWLIADPRTPDLAGQVYRVDLFRQLGFTVWDEHWYAGHDMPGYSLLFPPLGGLLGVRLLGTLCVLISVALFERLVRGAYGDAARWGACWFAVAAVTDVWAGRLTFALGVSLGLGAVLALVRRHPRVGAALAVLCAAASPVAGALLALAGVSAALARRSARPALVLAVPPALLIAAVVGLFGEGGWEPFPLTSLAATLLVVGAFLWGVPRDQRLLRTGAFVYLLACLLCVLVRTPLGSNVERFGVLLGGPLLLCVRPLPRPAAALGAVLCGVGAWTLWGPVRETIAVAGSDATQASYYAPVERYLRGRGPVRVEVPLTRSHWEAALLAPTVSLARGWEKQLDERFNGVLLAPRLESAGYERWLHAQAVAYVALPDVPTDPSSAGEARLIRSGPPYLREVFASRHWRVYAVRSPTPLASGPGALRALGHDSFTLDATAPGSFLVRVRFTRYLAVVRGRGCVAPAAGGWTRVRAAAPGRIEVRARFSLARAVAGGGSC